MHHQHQDDHSGSSSYHPKAGEHYYPPVDEPKDNHLSWSPHMAGYDHHVSLSNLTSLHRHTVIMFMYYIAICALFSAWTVN